MSVNNVERRLTLQAALYDAADTMRKKSEEAADGFDPSDYAAHAHAAAAFAKASLSFVQAGMTLSQRPAQQHPGRRAV